MLSFLLCGGSCRPALTFASLVTLVASLTGCIDSGAPARAISSTAAPTAEFVDHSPRPQSIPTVRYSRYTLVELVPETAQQDLMEQVIDITFPASLAPTVGEGLRYLLMRSGYQLCDETGEIGTLNTWPMPAALIHIGPLRLRDALQLLVGPGWRLDVDESLRRVCFVRSSHPRMPILVDPAVSADPSHSPPSSEHAP